MGGVDFSCLKAKLFPTLCMHSYLPTFGGRNWGIEAQIAGLGAKRKKLQKIGKIRQKMRANKLSGGQFGKYDAL